MPHKDSLSNLYLKLLNENNVQREPGTHTYHVEEVLLKDGLVVPAIVKFDAEWQNDDYESPEGIGRVKTHDAGFFIVPLQFAIPANAEAGDVAPYTPGQDVTEFVSPEGYTEVQEYLQGLYNDKRHWGSSNHYASGDE